MRQQFRNTWTTLNRHEKKSFIYLTIGGILVRILDILFLAGLVLLVQQFIKPDETVIKFLPLRISASMWFIAAFIVCFILKNLLSFYISVRQNRFQGNVAIRISAENLENHQFSSFSSFISNDSSKHIRNICFQPFEFSQYMLAGVQQIIIQSALVLLTITAVALLNWKLLFLLIVILLPPIALVFYFVRNKLAQLKKGIQESNESSFRYLLDALKGYVESNIYHRNKFFHKRFINKRREFSSSLFKSQALQTLPSGLIEIFAVAGLFILMLFSKESKGSHILLIGAFMAAAYKIIPGIVKIINAAGQMRAYGSDIQKLAPIKPFHSTENTNTIKLIELKNIGFDFNGKTILNGFNLDLKPGDVVAITGDSGIGKTTLINLILGLHHPHAGEVRINQAVMNGNARDFWKSFGYVRQQSFLFHDTILRNITLDETDYDKNKLDKALIISGLDEILQTWPEGLNTEILENGNNISGGQAQRISIARAIYSSPDVLLLDEPFNELDHTSSNKIFKNIREFCQPNKIAVLITHERELLNLCDKTVFLNEC